MTQAATKRGRGRPKKDAVTAAPKATKKSTKLKVIEPSPVEEGIDTSIVIDDFDMLRDAARNAMGDFANEAKDNIVEIIKAKKSGASQIHYVHPLSLHVLTGAEQINTREFANDEMRNRLIEFGNALNSEGIQKPLVAFVKGDRLCLVGGETRLRAVLHLYVRGMVPDPKASKVQYLPVLLERAGTNDFDRGLRVATDNDQKNLKPIEVAANIKYLFDLAEASGKPKMEAMERIASAYGRTVTFVYSHLSYMELPEVVIGLLRREPVAVSVAMATWKKTKENTAETMDQLNKALETMKASGARKVMPKHVEELAVKGGTEVPATDTDTGTVTTVAATDTDTGETDTGVSTGGVDVSVNTSVSKPGKTRITETLTTKADGLLKDVVLDGKFMLTDDGFVRLDTTSPSAPAIEWTVEDFQTIAKAYPDRVRVPAELALLEDATA